MDTVGEFLTRIRNAGLAKHEKVDVPSSKLREGIAGVLEKSGYIRSYKVVRDGKQGIMRLYLSYDPTGAPSFTSIERRSKPGRRYYVPKDKIPSVRSGFGVAILSTSKGVMSGDQAIKENLGGELLCTLY